MPQLNIDQFDKAPKVGDKVKVLGKVKSIDEESGEVEVSYDDVSIVKKSTKSNDDNSDNVDTMNMDQEMSPNTQSMDYALNQAFNRGQ